MRSPHLLRVDEDPPVYGELLRAAAAAGLRTGWMEFSSPPPPPELAAAAELGVLRAVAVGETGVVSVKPRRGAPVLKDLLREHFLGCSLVLLRGGGEAPRLAPAGPGWCLDLADGSRRRLTTGELIAALRRPSPWPSS